MLYPLSYEGLRCTFAQHVERVLVRRARAGCLALDGLCRTCAACREPADPPPSRHAAPIVRRVVPSQEPRLGSDEVTTVVLLAVVMLVGAIGASDGLGTDLGRSVLL
jgi:hypothetical protein